MPRDSNGTYTLPQSAVQPSTPIETTWANPSFDDFAAAFSDSLSRSGDGGMLVPFLNVDGTIASPGMAWSLEPGSGFYRFGSGDFRGVVQGSPVTRYRDDTASPAGEQSPFQVWNGSTWANVVTVAYTGQLLYGDGTVGAPTYSFLLSPTSGYWSSALDTLNWSINGVSVLQLDADSLEVGVTLELPGGALPATTGLADGALRYNDAGGLALKVNGAWQTIPATGLVNNGNLIEITAPITADTIAQVGYFNWIDTRLGEIELTMPAGVVGNRWGYIDFYRNFSEANCILVPNGADLIEGVNANYEMNIQGASGVMRYTAERGWVDTGGMS